MRVREELRTLGLTQRLCYKLDSDTLAGRLEVYLPHPARGAALAREQHWS